MSDSTAKAPEQTAPKPATTEQAVEGPATASTSTEPSKTQDDAVPTVTKISRFGLSLGKSIVTSHPLYLMGEAVLPGKKVGAGFNESRKKLMSDAEVLGKLISTSASDVVVIVDKQFKSGSPQTSKAAAVITEAKENALVVVTSSVEHARAQLERNAPGIKKAMLKNGRQAIVVVDKSLKNPLVISGVDKFAKTRGIPFSAAMLQVASLALSKILAAIPEDEDEQEEGEVRIRELDASELERTSSKEADQEAEAVSKKADGGKCCVS